MAESKKDLKVKIQTKELKFAIMNKSHVTARSLQAAGKLNYEAAAHMQASDDLENSYELIRAISNAVAETKVELGEYLNETTTETTNLINSKVENGEAITLDFLLPSNYNSAAADALGGGIHEFIVGTCPFLVQDPDTLSMFNGQLDPSQYTVIPMPVGADTGTAYLDYGFSGLGIPTTTKHPEEAWDFIKYMLSAENNAKFTKAYGPLPVHKSTYEKDSFFSSGDYTTWAYMMSHPETYIFVKYPLDAEQYPGWNQTQETTMQALLLGNATIDDTIKAWKEYWGY